MVVKHRIFHAEKGKRILCISDARGSLKQINRLATILKAYAVVHTGSFGFFDGESADHMSAALLASAARTSSLTPKELNYEHMDEVTLRESVGSQLSELPLYLAGVCKFNVPVYTIWGADEDVRVVEKFREGVYTVSNLHILDEHNAPLLAGTNIRLFGVSGKFVMHDLFNLDRGKSVPGNSGSAWTGIWQIGELAHTAAKCYSDEHVRILVCYSTPEESPLLHTLAHTLKCDFSMSRSNNPRKVTAGFSKLWADSDFNPLFKIQEAGNLLNKIWSAIEDRVIKACGENDAQKDLIISAVKLLTTDFSSAANQQNFRTLWHFGVCDITNNFLLLNWKNSQIAITAEVAKLDHKYHLDEYKSESFGMVSSQNSRTDEDGHVSDARYLGAELKKQKNKEKKRQKLKEKSKEMGKFRVKSLGAPDEVSGKAAGTIPNSKKLNSRKQRSESPVGEHHVRESPVSEPVARESSVSAPSASDITASAISASKPSTSEPSASTSLPSEPSHGIPPTAREPTASEPAVASESPASEPPASVSPSNEPVKNISPNNVATEEVHKSLPSGPSDKINSVKHEKQRPLKVKPEKANKPVKEKAPHRPGLWFKNGDRSPEQILRLLAREDRELNPKVEIKSEFKPNGTKSNIALVYFDTQEQASAAYDRVDKDEAGTVSIHHPKQFSSYKSMFRRTPKK